MSTLRRHAAALVYLAVGGFLVTRAGVRVEPRSYFGDFYPVFVAYPVFFWLATAAYGVLASAGRGWSPRRAVGGIVAVGVIAHLNFLSLSLLADEATIAKVAVSYFILYVHAVLALIVVGANIVGVASATGGRRRLSPPFWPAAGYLPLATLVFGPPKWAIPLVVAAAVLYGAWRAIRGARDAEWFVAARRLAANPRVFVCLVLLIGGSMRLVGAVRLAHMGRETVLLNSDDATQYDANARTILDKGASLGSKDTPGVSNYSPGYSLFLAGLYVATGRALLQTMVVQALLSSLVPIFLYVVGRRAVGERPARVASVLAAVSQLLIFNSVNLTREMSSLLFVLPMIWLLQRIVAARGEAWLLRLAAGILLGLLILIDPVFLVVCTVLSLADIVRGGRPVARRVAGVAAVWLAIFATVVPIKQLVVHPVGVIDELSLVTRPRVYSVHVSRDYSKYATELYKRGVNPFAYPVGSLVNLAHDPGTLVPLEIDKVWLDFRRFFFEGNTGYFFPLLLVANSFFASNILFYTIGCAFIGLFVIMRRIRGGGACARQLAVIQLVMFSYAVPYFVLIFGMTRFRATVQPIILLWVATGIVSVVEWILTQVAARPTGAPGVIEGGTVAAG